MAIVIPEVDTSIGLDLCDGNMKIYTNALRLFANGTPDDLKKMKGVTQDKMEEYSIAVHSVKSMSNYIGAEESRKTARELEILCKNGDFAAITARNDAFITYVEGIVANVRKWLAENSPQ